VPDRLASLAVRDGKSRGRSDRITSLVKQAVNGTADPPPPTTAAGWRLFALLIAISSVGPLSVNIIVPAIPGLALAFAADPAIVQLTVSLYFGGLGLAQLPLGSLSDRFGRRPVLLGGFAVTVLTSFAAAAATNVTALVVARTAQALGAATGIVIGRAIIRDLYARDRAASMLGWVTMSVVAVPMFGPLIGGLLEEAWGWRAIFLFIGITSLLTLLWAAIALPETRAPSAAGVHSARRLGKESRELLLTPAFAGFVLCSAMISGPFYTVMGGSAQIVITLMGRSATELGLWLVFASVGYMAGNFLAGSLSIRYGGSAMLWWGLFLELAGTLASALAVSAIPQVGPAAIFVPLFVVYVGNGMALPNAIAGAISVRPEAIGTASGVTGCVQMGWGAVISQLIAYPVADASSAAPFAWIMFAQALAGVLFFWVLVRPKHP
jgi:MFS transporter, DHA1 family, multidrug resistance protein